MLSSTPPTIPCPTSTAIRSRTGSLDALHAWGRRIPRPPPRRALWIGSRVLAIGLAAALALGSVTSSPAAQQTAPAAANSVYAQAPTPTPEPAVLIPAIEVQGPGSVVVPNRATSFPGTTVLPTTGPVTVVGCGSPDYIFQGCSIAPAGATEPERRLEARAIAVVLQQYQVPDSERPRVLRYARNEVRAALFGNIVQAFQKEPASRNADERLVVEALTRRVREKHVQAATVAQREYNKWASDPCGYHPPSGFTYSARQACIGISRAFRPESPGLQAFEAYGAAAAYETGQDATEAARVLGATANAVLLGYGYGVALGPGTAGAPGGSSELAPDTAFGRGLAAASAALALPALLGGLGVMTLETSVLTANGIMSVPNALVPGWAGSVSVGGPLLVVIAAVTTAILAGETVFREEAIPGQLQTALDTARSYDVGADIRSNDASKRTAGLQELFGAFVTATLPDYPGTEPAPPAQPGDPRLIVQGSPVDWLQYTAADGSQRAVRLSG